MIVIDYDKTLKSFESQDITNFEKLEITDDEKEATLDGWLMVERAGFEPTRHL